MGMANPPGTLWAGEEEQSSSLQDGFHVTTLYVAATYNVDNKTPM